MQLNRLPQSIDYGMLSNHLSNYSMVKHIHTSDANQRSTVATSSWPSQCLPVPPASCDWPAQDEVDITGCISIPLHSDYSAGSHNGLEMVGGEQERGVSSRISYSHKLYDTIRQDSLVSFSSHPLTLSPSHPPHPPGDGGRRTGERRE